MPNTWIKTQNGDVLRSDAIIGLQMSSDGLTALCINAQTVLLAGPGCGSW